MTKDEIYGDVGFEQFRRMKWAAVYGAWIAQRVSAMETHPTREQMAIIHTEAANIADDAEEAANEAAKRQRPLSPSSAA